MTLPSLARMVAVASVFVSSLFAEEAPKKIGIIGLDTGHVVAFTTVFNKGPKNPADAAKYSGFRVTAAFAQGSKDIPESTKRVPEYTASLKGMGVEIVDSIEKLCAQVDFVMLESNDGRVHLEQILPVLASFRARVQAQPDRYRLVRHVQDIERARAAGQLAVGFDLEGALPLLERPEMVTLFSDLGVRQMHFAYNRNNAVAGGCHDTPQGLTALGRRMVTAVNDAPTLTATGGTPSTGN